MDWVGQIDWAMAAAGLGVGFVVGLTGMGGGALMTPVLVLLFQVPPLAAVSSDLVASAVMKPVGAVVHVLRRTVDWRLVGWLCAGSVPCAFSGVLLARAAGSGQVQQVIRYAMGGALLLAVAGMAAKALLGRSRGRVGPDAQDGATGPDPKDGATRSPAAGAGRRVPARPVPTVLLGAVGGLLVGLTSVGSGSVIVVTLLIMYPMLRGSDLVGTDLVQAVPLVAAAALGHLLFGDFRLDVTGPLLLGSLPGVFLGAQVSARTRGGWLRPVLAVILLASALKLLGAPTVAATTAAAVAATGLLAGWLRARRPARRAAWPDRTAAVTADHCSRSADTRAERTKSTAN